MYLVNSAEPFLGLPMGDKWMTVGLDYHSEVSNLLFRALSELYFVGWT